MWPGVISRFAGSNARMARSSCGPNMSGLRASSEARLLAPFRVAPSVWPSLSFVWTLLRNRNLRQSDCGARATALPDGSVDARGQATDAATHVLDVVGGSGGRRGASVQGARHGAQA